MGKALVIAAVLGLLADAPVAYAEECRGCDAAEELIQGLTKKLPGRFEKLKGQLPGEAVLSPVRRVNNVVLLEFEYNTPSLQQADKMDQYMRAEATQIMQMAFIEAWCGDMASRKLLEQGVVVKTTVWLGPRRNVPIVAEVSRLNCV